MKLTVAKNTTTKVVKTLVIGAFAFAIFGLTSCKDINNPLNTDNADKGLGSPNDEIDQEIILESRTEYDAELKESPARRIPFDCFEITAEQKGKISAKAKKYDSLRLIATKEYKIKIEIIRKEAENNDSSSVNSDSLRKLWAELKTKDSLLQIQIEAIEKEYRQKADTVRIQFEAKMNAEVDSVAKITLRLQMIAELKVLKDEEHSKTKELRQQRHEIKKQMDLIKKTLDRKQCKKIELTEEQKAKVTNAKTIFIEIIIKIDAEFIAELKLILNAKQNTMLEEFLVTGKCGDHKKHKK